MNAEILSLVASTASVGLVLFERKWLNTLATRSEKTGGHEIEILDSNFFVKRLIRRTVASGVLTSLPAPHFFIFHPEVMQRLRVKRNKRVKIIIPLLLIVILIAYLMTRA